MLLGIVETAFYLRVSGEAAGAVTDPFSVNFSNVITLVVALGGLFIQMYVAAKKFAYDIACVWKAGPHVSILYVWILWAGL